MVLGIPMAALGLAGLLGVTILFSARHRRRAADADLQLSEIGMTGLQSYDGS
jgi:hypothetical protein